MLVSSWRPMRIKALATWLIGGSLQHFKRRSLRPRRSMSAKIVNWKAYLALRSSHALSLVGPRCLLGKADQSLDRQWHFRLLAFFGVFEVAMPHIFLLTLVYCVACSDRRTVST